MPPSRQGTIHTGDSMTRRWREVDSNPRSLSLDSREEKGRRSIRVVAKDAVPFHGGTDGSNPASSTEESANFQSLTARRSRKRCSSGYWADYSGPR